MQLYSIYANLAILAATLGYGIVSIAMQDTDSIYSVSGIEKSEDKATNDVESDTDIAFDGDDLHADKGKLGKRAGPSEVEPVTINDVKFVAIHWGKARDLEQNGGYIAAYNADTDEELWILKVYEVIYDPQKEQDVQDIFIQSLEKTDSGSKLLVTDEEGRTYIVDPATQAVRQR